MFTGIINKTAEVIDIKSGGGSFVVAVQNNLGKIKLGESISINGVCSTVKKKWKKYFFRIHARDAKTLKSWFFKER